MSQHIFNTESNEVPVKILMGYDRPFDGYFMMIIRMQPQRDENDFDEESEDDIYIYSNLIESDPHPKSLSNYVDRLAELNIKIPFQMIEEIIEDKVHCIGNKVVLHTLIDGKYSRHFI